MKIDSVILLLCSPLVAGLTSSGVAPIGETVLNTTTEVKTPVKVADPGLVASSAVAENDTKPVTNVTSGSTAPQATGILWLASAIKGGIAGSLSMLVNMIVTMPLHTIINVQYKTGHTLRETPGILWNEGGIMRFYSGLSFVLMLGLVLRFCDTATNRGLLAAYGEQLGDDRKWMLSVVTGVTFGFWRLVFMPLDTLKTRLQVEGTTGFTNLVNSVKSEGFTVLFNGFSQLILSSVTASVAFWSAYNFLERKYVVAVGVSYFHVMLKNGGIGFVSSVFSDILANVFRVMKVQDQTKEKGESTAFMRLYSLMKKGYYSEAKEHFTQTMTRGLAMRLLTRGFDGLIFSVAFKYFLGER